MGFRLLRIAGIDVHVDWSLAIIFVLLLSSLAKHEHRSVVEAYGHVNLGFSEKELRKFAEKAGLEIANAETVTRERRPPHFEVLSLTAVKP